MIEYLTALLVVALPLGVFTRGPLDLCAALICANWLAAWLFNHFMGTYTPWGLLLMLDSLCAVLMILNRRGSYWPLVIAGSFVPMILCHFVYANGNSNWSQHDYWDTLTAWAFVQLGLLGLWGVWHVGTHIIGSFIRPNLSSDHNFNHQGIKP